MPAQGNERFENVIRIFEELCAVPHGSGNTAAISGLCAAFAEKRKLPCTRDATGNLVIRRKASPGKEDVPPVILQAHLDMVCVRTSGLPKDMSCEGLELRRDGDWMYAEGTSLGADDCIGVAMLLAAAEDPALVAPELEIVLTVDEEVGMTGCSVLDVSGLRGRRLINLDSDEEGVFFAGCAGGVIADCRVPVTRVLPAPEESGLRICLGGGIGGHSGEEIGRGRSSANQLMGRVLHAASGAAPVRLVAVSGGDKYNAIPTGCTAELVTADPAAARRAAEAEASAIRQEYAHADPRLTFDIEPYTSQTLPMDAGSSERCIGFLSRAPHGVTAMCADIPGLPQTSLNLGILRTGDDFMDAGFLIRSMSAVEKNDLVSLLRRLAGKAGGDVRLSGNYAEWPYRKDSPLLKTMTEFYREKCGREPRIAVCHGGMECGILSAKIPGLDCVSIGPDIRDIHTPQERLSMKSTERVWDYFVELLQVL